MPSNPLELKYEQDGDEAKEIAKYLPYFPFKVSAWYALSTIIANRDLESLNLVAASTLTTLYFLFFQGH
jgi:hypothetical protein